MAQSERLGEVDIERVRGTRFGRRGNLGRMLDYATYAVAARRRLQERCAPGDVVIAGTDPPLLGPFLLPVAQARGATLINWLHDLFPEVAVALGMSLLSGRMGGRLAAWRTRALRRASVNVVLGDTMAERVRELGVSPANIEVIHNWADGEAISPIAASESTLRGAWGLHDQFVVGYSGNFGLVHEFETILDAAKALRDRSDISFLFIGEGARKDAFRMAVEREQLSNVLFKPYQPRERLGDSLGVPDVHLLSLRLGLEGLVLPSKLYGILAAGRPALYVGERDGEIAAALTCAGCGQTLKPGDVDGLVKAILDRADNQAKHLDEGERARLMFDRRFSLPRAIDEWRALLERSVA